jgi:hypothetical protein
MFSTKPSKYHNILIICIVSILIFQVIPIPKVSSDQGVWYYSHTNANYRFYYGMGTIGAYLSQVQYQWSTNNWIWIAKYINLPFI